MVSDLNWYDLYQPPSGALMTDEERIGRSVLKNGEEKVYKRGKTMAEYTPWIKHLVSKKNNLVSASFLSDYINNHTVREALNIPDFVPAWEMCSSTLDYHLSNEASMWIYHVMKANGIKMFFYSGDTDGAVPTFGSKRWQEELNWPVVNDWKPWLVDYQVAGYQI